MNNLFNKIKKARELIGLSQQQFADEAGVSQRDVSQLENGKREFIPNSIILLLNKYLIDINSIFNDGTDVLLLSDKIKYVAPKGLPLIAIEVMAGMSNGDMPALELDTEYYYIPEFQKKADFLIRVSGTSMSPKYYNGDVIACKKIPKETFIQWGKVYVMDTIQGALCKRLFKSEKGDKFISVVSDNDKYPPFDMEKKEIRALAIVIGVIRLE